MSHVFISYAHADERYVKNLTRELKSQDIPYWYDQEMSIGVKWTDNIDQKIGESFALILVMTPNSRKSDYVNYEWAYAMGKGIEIIPVIYEYLKADDEPWHKKIMDHHYGDAIANMERIIESIKKLQHPTSIYIPKHPKIGEIEKAWSNHKTEQYENLIDIKSGCVVAVITEDGDDQALLDIVNNLSDEQRQKLKIIAYRGSEDTPLFGKLTAQGVSISKMPDSFKRGFDSALKELDS